MRQFLFIILLGVLTGQVGLYAQPEFVTLIEERASGKLDTMFADEPAIVDINSIIRLKIELTEVEEALFGFQGISSSDTRLKSLRTLNDILRYENQILDLLESDLRDKQNFFTLVELENSVYDLIDKNPALADEVDSEPVQEEYRKYSEDGKNPYILFLLQYLEAKADEIRATFLQELGVDNDSADLVFFRLGAFLKSRTGGRAIHVEHFDDIDKGPYTEKKSFFGKPLGEEEIAALRENKSLVDSLTVNFTQSQLSIGQTIKAKSQNLFPSRAKYRELRSTVKLAVDNIKEETQATQTDSTSTPVLLDKITQLGLDDVATFYTSFSSQFEQIGLGVEKQNPLQVEYLLGVLTSIENVVDAPDITFLEKPEEGNVVSSNLTEVKNSFVSYKEAVKKDVSDLRSFLNSVVSVLNVFKKPYLESEKFSEKVKRFTAGNIPETGYIELRYIGERKKGDEILIKAVLQKGIDEEPEEREVFRRYISIQRVDPHVKMSGSLILASPMNRRQMIFDGRISEDLSEFQFAPTYGIFMKWGSRKSHFYNEFVQFGLGLAFSSPDFSLDGTPEFATGVMATAFRDIISGGIGWNFSQGAPYSFVGFNIPFSIGGLPFAKPPTNEFEDF